MFLSKQTSKKQIIGILNESSCTHLLSAYDSDSNLLPERIMSPRSMLPSLSHTDLFPDETSCQLSKRYMPLE